MTMIRLFVFDVDGTALPYGEAALSEAILADLRALCDNGVRLAVASGRSAESLRLLLRPLDRPVYIIAHDGAIAYEDGRAVYRRPITGEAVRAYFRAPQNKERTLLFYGENATYIRHGNGDHAALADVCAPLTEIQSEYALREPIYKVAAYGGSSGRPLPPDPCLRRTFRVDTAEEYVCAYANKGTALSDLQTRLPVAVYDTAVAGDGRADLPMFTRAALSFAPDGAPADIRDAAKITGSFADFLAVLVKTTQNRL